MNANENTKTRDPRRRIDILGVLVDEIVLEEAVDAIAQWAWQKRQNPSQPGKLVVTVNPEYVMEAGKDREFRDLVNNAALVTPDGVGVVLAGKFYKSPFRSRVTGVELTHALARRSAENGMSLFLLGAAPGVAEEAAEALRRLYPGVVIAGCFSGKAGPEGDEETLRAVQEARPDIVLVAYGQKKQDFWSARNLDKCGAAVAIGIGGTFDYLSGRVSHAPATVRRFGLEWLYRLYREPWRWKRDLAMLHFASIVIWSAFFQLKVLGQSNQALVYQYDQPYTVQPQPVPVSEPAGADYLQVRSA